MEISFHWNHWNDQKYQEFFFMPGFGPMVVIIGCQPNATMNTFSAEKEWNHSFWNYVQGGRLPSSIYFRKRVVQSSADSSPNLSIFRPLAVWFWLTTYVLRIVPKFELVPTPSVYVCQHASDSVYIMSYLVMIGLLVSRAMLDLSGSWSAKVSLHISSLNAWHVFSDNTGHTML